MKEPKKKVNKPEPMSDEELRRWAEQDMLERYRESGNVRYLQAVGRLKDRDWWVRPEPAGNTGQVIDDAQLKRIADIAELIRLGHCPGCQCERKS